jgi:hypothetical protein
MEVFEKDCWWKSVVVGAPPAGIQVQLIGTLLHASSPGVSHQPAVNARCLVTQPKTHVLKFL